MSALLFRPGSKLLAVVAVLGLMVAATGLAAAPDTIEARAAALLARMSLDEKIGQLNLASNDPDFDRGTIARGEVGGVLAFTSGTDIAAVQAIARGSRLGIPLLVGLDVVHGLRTMFPVPLGEAASFDPALAREAAAVAAREATAIGINWTFAPMADLSRDPRWGRIVEGFGEDPTLGRAFTAARVEGFAAGGLATTLKHFAGYGAAIGGRDYDAAAIANGDLFDNYLPPFRAGVAAGATSVMPAFNTLNGVPATANPFLLHEVLRARWGFDGFTVSDWYAVAQLQDHGVAADPAEAARVAFLAGTDLDMASGLYAKHLADEVRAGRVPETAVTEAAGRVLRAKLRLGLFDRPVMPANGGAPAAPSPEAREAARRIARDTIVLLRNTGALPIAAGQGGSPHRIAVVGGMAASGRDLIGPHGALVKYEDGVPLLDALRERAERAGIAVDFSPGCDAGCGDAQGFAAAAAAAAAADLVIAVMGEPLDLTGEAASRAHLTLPGRGAELLDRLVATGKPVVLVLLASRPVELGPAVDRLAGLAMAWFPGTEGGHALADILFGDADPSAKLPISWPRTVGQVPITYDRLPTGRPPDPKNRFTLRYVDEELTPLFPFGFGLTYTRFAISDIALERATLPADGTLAVSAEIANIGDSPGRDVVQLYVRQVVGSESRPLRQLKAFEKVALAPGERRRLTFRVPAAELGYTDRAGRYRVEHGPYQVMVGDSSDATPGASFTVRADQR